MNGLRGDTSIRKRIELDLSTLKTGVSALISGFILDCI